MGSGLTIEDRLHAFYLGRLEGVGSFAELRRFAKNKHAGSLDFLKAELTDLLPEAGHEAPGHAFPKTVKLGGSTLPLRYRNEPGGDADGVTLQVPISQFGAIREGLLDWAVPGHLEEKIESLLRGLPKPIRVSLHPLKERAVHISRQLQPSDRPLREISVSICFPNTKSAPTATTGPQCTTGISEARIQVQNNQGEVLSAGATSTPCVQQDAEQAALQGNGLDRIPAWQQAAARHEREQLREWNFGNLPEVIDLTGEAGLVKAYPALVAERGLVHLRLLPTIQCAAAWPKLAGTG